jgi:hypothetical protein
MMLSGSNAGESYKPLAREKKQPKGGLMQQNQKQNAISPDIICQQAIQAKLNVYQAKEQFETVLAQYNGQVDNLVNLVNLMKTRILELEGGKPKNNGKPA